MRQDRLFHFAARLVLLAALFFPAQALAQAQLAPGHVMGNSTAAQRPARDESITAMLDRAFGSTRGAILERTATGWGLIAPSASAGAGFISNGTGADPSYCTPSGTCLDDITGFSSTGFLQRTGAGAYSFVGTIGSGSVVLGTAFTGTGTIIALQTSPSFTTPTLGVAGGTSLALGGCTIGANALCTTGNEAVAGTLTVTSSSASALAVGQTGATNPALAVDASTASSVTGINIKSGATGTAVTLTATDSGANTSTNINSKGTGVVALNGAFSVGTGGATISGGALVGSGSGLPASSAANQYNYTVATGTFTLGTSAIASGACATVVTVAGTGIATTDVIDVGFNGDPTAITGYTAPNMLSIIPYPTAGNANVKVCNNTTASITPGAVTLNWRVRR